MVEGTFIIFNTSSIVREVNMDKLHSFSVVPLKKKA